MESRPLRKCCWRKRDRREPHDSRLRTSSGGGLGSRAALSSRLKVSRIPGEFDKWQARVSYHNLIRAYSQRGFKPCTGSERDVVILVDTITAHPYASYQLPVFV